MKKKERIELYRLIESKFKEKYINGIVPSIEDFEKYGLSKKDLKEFMNLYSGHWNHYLFWKGELDLMPESELRMPPDSVFFNFGVKNIDIVELKLLLHLRHSIIIIEKSTGYVTATWSGGGEIRSNGNGSKENDIDDYFIIEIKNYDDFFRNLEKGNMKEILSVKLFEKRYYNIPSSFDLYQAQKVIDLYLFASFLKSEPTVLAYEEFLEWWGFKNLAEFVNIGDEEIGYSDKAIVFRLNNPKKIYSELLNGNIEILSEIKKIENI